MGSPKRRARNRGPLWRRCFYRVCYVFLLVASGYLVLTQLRSRLAPSASEHLSGEQRLTAGEGDAGVLLAEPTTLIPLPVVDNLSQPMRKWIQKPNSLCFGIGSITVLTVTPGLPQVGCHCLVRPCLFLLLPVLFQAVITAQDCKTSALGKLPSALCWQAFLEQLRKNRLSYAYKHGYRYCEVSTVLDLFSPVPWTKISAVMLVLSFADVVVHMHPDALIRNDSITIESIIDVPHHNGSFKDVIYSSALGSSRVVEPSMKVAIDTGVFIVKSTAWSRAYLEVLCRFFRTSLLHRISEDDALELYRSNHFVEFCEHVAILPFWYLNSPCGDQYNSYEPGDFVARYLGAEGAQKYLGLASMLRMEAVAT